MKIRSIRIHSFGGLREKSFSDLGDGLTVFYGKNESGKTTTMEFIRTTLFRNSKRDKYPLSSPTDSGEITVENSDGKKTTLSRKKNDISPSPSMPKELEDIDYNTYSTIYAMSPSDLRNSKIISDGDIGKKFLSVPGGEVLPDVIKDIEVEMKTLLPEARWNDSTEISALMKEIENIDRQIAESGNTGSKYDDLATQRDRILSEIVALKEKDRSFRDADKKRTLMNSQNSNMASLEAKRKELSEKKPAVEISMDVWNSYIQADAEKRMAEGVLKDAQIDTESAKIKLRGTDPDRIVAHSEEIEELRKNLGLYADLKAQPTHIKTIPEKTYAPVKKEVKIPMGIIALGCVLAVAGLLTNIYLSVVGAVLIAIGFMFMSKRPAVQTPPVHTPVEKQSDQILVQLEKKLDRVADDIGIERRNFDDDVSLLFMLMRNAESYRTFLDEENKAKNKVKEATINLNTVTSVAGGTDSFVKCHDETVYCDKLAKDIEILEGSIASSGYKEGEYIPEDVTDVSDELNDRNRELGQIENEMRSIRDDEEIGRLLDRRASLEDRLDLAVRRWMMLSAAMNLIDTSCKEIYGSVQPGVVQSADVFLDMMTAGKYRLDRDPRNEGITVLSGEEKREEKEWSTGTGDQIYLSMKMGVAKELSSGKLPVILDDVLLTFDSERKEGGCKALSLLSEDLQILYFTCDAETRDLMRKAGADIVVLNRSN